MKRNLLFIVPACLTLFSASFPAFAGTRVAAHNHDGQVTACSRYANGCYTADSSSGHYGRQLVLHHGTRIDCDRDCKNTLRESTIDFWDTMRENGG